jgi:hypothetical protein
MNTTATVDQYDHVAAASYTLDLAGRLRGGRGLGGGDVHPPLPQRGIGALGPAVGNDILCALTWCAALTVGYAATCRLACIFR